MGRQKNANGEGPSSGEVHPPVTLDTVMAKLIEMEKKMRSLGNL